MNIKQNFFTNTNLLGYTAHDSILVLHCSS